MKRRGMAKNVERAFNWREASGADDRHSPQGRGGSCGICGGALEFHVLTALEGGYGQTIERCTNGGCPGRFGHRPTPDLTGRPPRDPHPIRHRRTRGDRADDLDRDALNALNARKA